MRNVRFGIIGSGFMGLTHAKAVSDTSDAELIAIAGGTRAPKLATDFGCSLEPTPEDLINREDVDAIIIATPHYVHAQHALLAAGRGKHLLVEKPLATTLADCDLMIEAAQRARRILAVGLHQRFRDNNRAARTVVRAGTLGRILSIQVTALASMSPLFADPGFGGKWAWWQDPRSLGYIINLGPHVVDLLRWMLNTEIVSVAAFCRMFKEHSEVEDTTVAVFELANGAIGTLISSYLAPSPSFPGEDFRFRFIGSDAVMDLDPYSDLRISEEGKLKTIASQPPIGHTASSSVLGSVRMAAFYQQIQEFIAAVRGEASGIADGHDGRVAVEVCIGMLEASQSRLICSWPVDRRLRTPD